MSAADQIVRLPVACIRVPQGHRTTDYSEAEVIAFSRAILATGGIENALLVRVAEDGEYELVSGGLRLAAAIYLGWTEVPCRVRQLDARAAKMVGLLEDRAGKVQKSLPLGWDLIRGMEATGWSQAGLAAVLGMKPSKVSEAVKAARAIPETLLLEVAASNDVPAEVARTLGRTELREISKLRDAEARRTALGEALQELAAPSAVDARHDPSPAAIKVATEPVRIDAGAVAALRPVSFLRVVMRTLWHLTRVWLGSSPPFAKVRPANSRTTV